MKFLIIAALGAVLAGCVDAPADLYGVHQVKPQTRDTHFVPINLAHGGLAR